MGGPGIEAERGALNGEPSYKRQSNIDTICGHFIQTGLVRGPTRNTICLKANPFASRVTLTSKPVSSRKYRKSYL